MYQEMSQDEKNDWGKANLYFMYPSFLLIAESYNDRVHAIAINLESTIACAAMFRFSMKTAVFITCPHQSIYNLTFFSKHRWQYGMFVLLLVRAGNSTVRQG
jgi:hypothetical protein